MPLRKTRYRREPVTEVNITNLIDIIMVLLIVFILVSNFVDTGLNIELPNAEYSETAGKQEIVIGITAADTISLNGDVVSKEDLLLELKAIYTEKPQSKVFIHSDEYAMFQQVYSVLSIVNEAGYTQVGFAGDRISPTSG